MLEQKIFNQYDVCCLVAVQTVSKHFVHIRLLNFLCGAFPVAPHLYVFQVSFAVLKKQFPKKILFPRQIRAICRTLKCTRIAIHIQLFLSFAFNNFMWIIWYYFVFGDSTTVEKNGVSI